VINKILKAMYEITGVYVDNISIKGLKTNYKGEEVILGIRRFMYKYIINYNKVLLEIKRIGITIGAEKT
jgi:hypothetical protein